MTIAIIDYGMANLRSVQKAFERVGHAATITNEANVIARAERVVLPGVGAFRDAIARLRETGLDAVIRDYVDSGRPFLGICLGLQLLFDRSFEDGENAGLGILAGDVVKIEPRPGLKVPHMGWNPLTLTQPACPLFAGLESGEAVYFVHSYYAVPVDASIVAATADYPTPITAAIARRNIIATQFHPEKSQDAGLAMLANFARLS